MKIKNRVILAYTCLTVLGLAVVLFAEQTARLAAADEEPPPNTQASAQVVNAKLVAANTSLSFKLFSEILKQQPDENIFISPAGVAIALTMTYNGASGQTQQAIAKTLEVQGMSLQEINQANATLKATLENPESKLQLSVANSLWLKEDEPFKPEFIQKIRDFYGAEVRNLNFGEPTAPSIINAWVKQSTNEKINKIIDDKELEPDTVFVLLNAIYFRGTWAYPFPKDATRESSFTLLDGTQKRHPMMSQEISGVAYYENDIFQAVELPYGEGRLRMCIFLPNQGISLKTFYERLNVENWKKWMNQLNNYQGDRSEGILIGLPRLNLEYSIELKDTLKALGMEEAFGDSADFSAMTPSRLWIDKVKHKSFVEVNEEGTEAAAVTQVGGTRGGGRMMLVNRPFFFAIRDNQTNTILFMGSIVEPK
jgi:serpin B